MNKKWYEILDFYRLTGLLCFWIASWLFMIPYKISVNSPLYDNMWGGVFSFFGIVNKETQNVQILPDLMCGLLALFIMCVMHLRGFYSILLVKNSKNRLFMVLMNIFSIAVRTLFFTIILKVFLFPDTGLSSMPFIQRMKQNFWLSIFTVFCITGMILGVQSVAKFLFLLLFATGILRNIIFISGVMGITGFIAILMFAVGFYFDLCAGGINTDLIISDFNILSGKYSELVKNSMEELKNVKK